MRDSASTLPRSSQYPQRTRFDCPLFPDKSSELRDLSKSEKLAYLLSLRDHGISVVAISQQYHVPLCTLYYWLSRHKIYHTYEDRSSAPHRTRGKVTEGIKAAVLGKRRRNTRLGCWRLSLFQYDLSSGCVDTHIGIERLPMGDWKYRADHCNDTPLGMWPP